LRRSGTIRCMDSYRALLGPTIQAGGSVLAAALITYGAINVADRFDPKFVRVGDHVVNIDHLVEIAEADSGRGCVIIVTISRGRLVDLPDGGFRQELAGQELHDEISCDVLRQALDRYSIDGRPIFVPRSQAR